MKTIYCNEILQDKENKENKKIKKLHGTDKIQLF